MSINQTIYGTSEQWVSTYYQQSGLSNKNKKAWFGGSTAQTQLRAGVAAGKLSYSDPIDKTLAYCGFGTESALNHRAYIGRDPENTGALKIFEYQDSEISNWSFFEKTAQYGETNALSPSLDNGYIRIDDLGRTAWNENINDEWNYSKYLEPYTYVNPHNMVLLINVIAGSSLDSSQQLDLATYIQNRASYPYLYTVYGNLYFGTLPERNIFAGMGTPPIGWKTSTLQCLDNYVCQAKNIDIPMYSITYGGSCILMGTPTKDRIMQRDADILNLAYVTEEGKEHLKIPTISGTSHCYIEYYDNLIEDILKTAACLGLYFTTSSSVAISGSLTDENMYIGILNSNGIGHGEYLRGAQTVNAPQAANDFTDMHQINYNPDAEIDPNTYYDSTTLPLLGGYTPTEYYVSPVSPLHSSAVVSALNELAEIPEPADQFNWEKLFMWQEPIECIIAWRIIYLKPSYNSTRFTNVKIGWFVTSDASSKMYVNSDEQRRIDLGEKIIFPHFGNCLDYDPYTKMSLYVPFCGSIEIPPSQFMNHKLHLYINVNDRTGEMEVLIMLDNKLWGSMKGNASIEYPLSGSRSMEYIQRKLQIENQITDAEFSGIVGMLGNAAGATISFVHGNIAGSVIQVGSGIVSAMESIDKVTRLEYELEHTNNKIVNLQKDSPTVSLLSVTYPFILIQRPQLLPGYSEEIYSKTVGFATLENTYKSNVYGYTEAINPLLDGISCTITEKNLIVEALKNGCIFDEKE